MSLRALSKKAKDGRLTNPKDIEECKKIMGIDPVVEKYRKYFIDCARDKTKAGVKKRHQAERALFMARYGGPRAYKILEDHIPLDDKGRLVKKKT